MSITILIFTFNVLVGYVCNVLFVPDVGFWTLTLWFFGAVIFEIALNAFIATLVCKWMPDKWFDHNKKIFSVPRWETNLYVKLGVKKWKDSVLELGQLNGFKKDKLASTSDEQYTEMFLRECNKGYIDHLTSIVLSALVLVLFIPKPLLMLTIGLPIIWTSWLINFMSLAILRYNMPRLKKMLELNRRRQQVALKNAQRAAQQVQIDDDTEEEPKQAAA